MDARLLDLIKKMSLSEHQKMQLIVDAYDSRPIFRNIKTGEGHPELEQARAFLAKITSPVEGL